MYADYDVTYLSHAVADLPVVLVGRRRSDRVMRPLGLRNVCATAARPSAAPKQSKPGQGRPPGPKNKHRAKRHDVGKTVKRAESIKKHQARRG